MADWILRLVLVLTFSFAGASAAFAQQADADKINPFNIELLQSLREAEPDVVLVGNSMQGAGINFNSLSEQLGLKVYDLRRGGSMSIWHYSVLEYVLPKLEKKPRMVVVIERNNSFTAPQKRVSSQETASRQMAGNEDWRMVYRLAVLGEGQPEWDGKWDGATTPLDGFYWDFEKAVNTSLLPQMIQRAKKNGYQLVIARHRTVDLARSESYPPQMEQYANDMAYYLKANGVPFLDYDREARLTWDLYANGDHLNPEGKEIWTDFMAADLKALLAGERAPHQHLPPKDYKPSAELEKVASAMPKFEPLPKEVLAKMPPAPEPPAVIRVVTTEGGKTETEVSIPKPPVNKKSDLTANLESIIYFGRGIRSDRIIIAVAALPGPHTDLGWLQRESNRTAIGAVPLNLSEAFSKVENREDLYLSPTTLSPKGVEFAAEAIAAQVREKFPFVSAPLQVYSTRPATVEAKPGVTLSINQVVEGSSKQLMQPSHETRLTLVGDGNVGMYSDPGLGMGEHAGLGEHLSKALGRPLQWRWNPKHPRDSILEMIGDINMEQTTVVLWVFMGDTLAGPRWGPIRAPDLDEGDLPQRLLVQAKSKTLSPPPSPDVNELYPDTVNYTLWEVQEVLEGEYEPTELVTVEWSQKDMNFLRPFQYEVGQTMTLEVIPLNDAIRQDRTIRQADFRDAVQRDDLPSFWIVDHKE